MTLKLVEQLNDARHDTLQRFEINGQHIGYIRPALAERLIARAPALLGETAPRTVSVLLQDLSPAQVTAALARLQDALAAEGILPKPAGEKVDVRASLTSAPVCQIDRNLIFPLGVISRGVHVILRHENGDFVIAQRSNKVFTFQGAYDVSVGGLLPAGKDPWDHVKTEAAEEAGLDATRIRPDGSALVLAYARNVQGQQAGGTYKPAYPFETDGGTNWDEVFFWTAIIPDDVTPAPRDGEVKTFLRMSPEDMLHNLRTQPQAWKTNSGVMLLQALALDPAHSARFTAEEHKALNGLLVADPRPLDSRGEQPRQASPATPRSPRPQG